MRVLGFGNVCGVDMDRFNPNRFVNTRKDGNVFTFVFVGRIVGDKGINELVEAFTQLHEKYQNVRLVLVGNFEEKLDPVKPVTIQRIKANSAIEACGHKSGDDLIMEYLKADCFVMPSYREGFPNTVLEAGAMGLPSIVTDINGSREIISEGVNGMVVPPFTVQPLFDAMERMIIDNNAYEKMRDNARQIIESKFEKNFVQSCLIDYYKEIIS